jgi:hypothetical protein
MINRREIMRLVDEYVAACGDAYPQADMARDRLMEALAASSPRPEAAPACACGRATPGTVTIHNADPRACHLSTPRPEAADTIWCVSCDSAAPVLCRACVQAVRREYGDADSGDLTAPPRPEAQDARRAALEEAARQVEAMDENGEGWIVNLAARIRALADAPAPTTDPEETKP